MNFITKVLAAHLPISAGGSDIGSDLPVSARGTDVGSCAGGSNGIGNPLGGSICSINALIAKILDLVVQIGLPIIVLMIIYAGFKYVTARGNKDKVSEAHSILLWTVVGAAIVLGAKVISFAIQGTISALK